jgi:hypothetical protein
MRFDIGWYQQEAALYTRFVRRYSSNAAQYINEILQQVGPEPAYRAAFALVQLNNELNRSASVKNLDKYRQLMSDYPEALPMFELALNGFMVDVGTRAM